MRVVLTGSSGQLGAYLLERLVEARHEVSAWSGRDSGVRAGIELSPVDLTDPYATERALDEADPELIIHAAAMSSAEDVRRDVARARAVNVDATARIAEWCTRRGCRMIFTSTDLVFAGTRSWYREDDPAEPVVAYGRTKREAEPAVLAVPRGLVARISLLYGPSRCGRPSYYDRTIDGLCKGVPQVLFDDEFRTPLDLASAAAALVALAESDVRGLIHVGGRERVSRYDLIRRVALALGLDSGLVHANRQADAALPEPRPADVSLDSERLAAHVPGLVRPTIEEAVASFSGEA
jgi:dTDP-4-dehydrorhamnose reductase